MRIFSYIVLLSLPFLLVLHPAAAQPRAVVSTATIDTIIVSTDGSTEPYVILNEMTLKQGMGTTPQAIEYDRNRIYSLGLFTNVNILFDSLRAPRILYVVVTERWHLFPVPIFGFRYGDPKKIYFGAGVLHNNFRGRNQKLYGALVLGYDPSIDLSFVDPLVDRESKLSFGCNFGFQRVRNRSEIEAQETGQFDEEHYDINASLGKRLSLFESIGLTLGYTAVSVSEYQPHRTLSSDGVDRFGYAMVSVRRDTRDLGEYPSRGALVSGYISKYGFGEAVVNFARYGIDLRSYIPLPASVTLVGRFYGSIVSGGEVPTYSHVYLGYSERVRGFFTTVFEGEDILGATLELRYPLLAQQTFFMSAIPLPPEFAVWRFGISLALFADAGTTWYRGDNLSLSSLASGYGAGVHFLLPYSVIVRVEYAFNKYGEGQFILDFRWPI